MSDESGVRRFVERFGVLLAEAGMARMPARAFACILAEDTGRLTAAELAERLEVSPAAISGAVRYLAQARLVVRGREPGERRDHYAVHDDVWTDMYVSRMALLRTWEQALDEGVQLLGADRPRAGGSPRRARSSPSCRARCRRSSGAGRRIRPRAACDQAPAIAATTPAATKATTSTASASGQRAHPERRAAPARRRPAGGRGPSSSRAVASPPRGTRMSRGPAARKSGTSKPPERRTSDGTPASSSRPWSSSASGWLLRRGDPDRARPRRRAGGPCGRARCASSSRGGRRRRRAPARRASRSGGRSARSWRRRCRRPGTRAAGHVRPPRPRARASETWPSTIRQARTSSAPGP